MMVGLGASLVAGQAAHLDLAGRRRIRAGKACVAGTAKADRLLQQDLKSLRWEIEAFNLDAIVCTGKRVVDHVGILLDSEVGEEGAIPMGLLAAIRCSAARTGLGA